jgi:hypothetical protein
MVKLGLVINRGNPNVLNAQTRSIDRSIDRSIENKLQSTPNQTQIPPGLSLRRVMNAPKTGCKSCGS